MIQEELKKAVSWSALDYILPGTVIGVGSGSTVAHFIYALASIKNSINGAVSSSNSSTKQLKSLGIPVLDLNEVDEVIVYVDSADEINCNLQMIKGGGAALTREKIIAAAAKKFICIVDESKKVEQLGKFPLPIEIIPMARTYITRELVKLGGLPKYRVGTITDNGNIILDVHNLHITDPVYLEKTINSLPGVVTVGLFAIHTAANIALISTTTGIKTIIK
ncbi:ribose-5-phosphate isomerase RpiA [Candidatus Pantoea carbekii]|uniref:Ribose-5-phosphate isomerase A n=1 Tax=Candidatus Pantoea carbekii TaxID=1235990 RepID=U3U6Y6_9GAMM|nr:ribose-5-phosphate isomerase RpiA [Candidatus Pantoea carbekii]AKC32385.1 ribose-5-phosphate isomerase A RpiA [Candidatus Pantoea carbekii]BAO00107.1 RpiA protein [Candidatus Pantoea carbekii]